MDGVLDKYRSNRYCDMGYDHDNQCMYIRFLSMDSNKPAQSAVRFHWQQGMVRINPSEYINVPPRQMQHWRQHSIK
jgi:hypothetical protein